KVVLVDCDLRRPNVRVTAGLKVELDIIDVLRGACKLEDALMKDPKSSLQILPAIKQIKNAPDLLASEAMERIIAKLRSEYDLVIIDSAPILPVNDTKVLTPHVDSILFVVRWENTPRDAAAEAVKSLREIHAPIAGIALTRADTQRFQYYSFGYGSYGGSYLEYYGDGA
ncbi:MAG TPA: CpsD/CapB family tyrosine-protein kinase, partial [Steroidobacteraceae bacterium]|nr:CpsD/CapB family tyrosine-protein kinase [Steroidobacteraceae bacterium]